MVETSALVVERYQVWVLGAGAFGVRGYLFPMSSSTFSVRAHLAPWVLISGRRVR